MYPIMTGAQVNFRPIIDSSVTCSYYNNDYEYSENAAKARKKLQVYYIVEEMPAPKISMSELKNALRENVMFNNDEMTLNGLIYLQCVVNCYGKAGDYQLNYCPTEFANIGCQIINVFRKKVQNWEPGIQRKKNVDVLVSIKINIQKGSFEIVAPEF